MPVQTTLEGGSVLTVYSFAGIHRFARLATDALSVGRQLLDYEGKIRPGSLIMSTWPVVRSTIAAWSSVAMTQWDESVKKSSAAARPGMSMRLVSWPVARLNRMRTSASGVATSASAESPVTTSRSTRPWSISSFGVAALTSRIVGFPGSEAASTGPASSVRPRQHATAVAASPATGTGLVA
jgi:hypothetical protein